MTRDDLINRLVARKMNASDGAKNATCATCIWCLAGPARKLCWAAAPRPAVAKPKN